jgi:hypothetical protein
MDPQISFGIICGIIGGLVVLVLAIIMPRPQCPDCGERFPRFRKPASGKQALWGGNTCTHCGCEVDRRGHKIEVGAGHSH